MKEQIEEILKYWFDGLDDSTPVDTNSAQFRTWFGKDDATDREIGARFEDVYEQAAEGACGGWETSPRGMLALVILLDQFPRNLYRETSRAFETDSRALAVCLRAMGKGADENLSLIERMFLYMPLMHAESREIQEKSLQSFSLLEQLAGNRSPENVDFFAYSHEYAKKHKAIIDRFGHYPHRNAALGRRTTPEEDEFLKGPDSSF